MARPPPVDLVPFGVLVTDGSGSAVSANRAWRRLTGQADPRWEGRGWLDLLEPHDQDAFLDAVRSARGLEADVVIDDSDSSPRVLHLEAIPHAHSGLDVTVVTAVDVTEDRARVARLIEQATRDPLTGLLNRASFYDFVGHALDRLRRDHDGLIAVFFIDVDDLKRTNDTLGHDAGDALLREVAARIVGSVRPVDVVARYAGDEFTVLCEDLVGEEEAATIADRITKAVHHDAAGASPRVSIGFAVADTPGGDPASVVAAADREMYRAKQNRRRPAETSDSTVEAAVVDRLAVAAHEMRSPLKTIAGFASTLRGGGLDAPDADEALAIIERQSERLVAILDELLDLGREAHARDAASTVDLADVVADALEAAPPPADATVTVSAGEHVLVTTTARRSRLARLLVNLLTNAYRYGGPTITISAHTEGLEVALTVEDDGDGIPDELASTLFAPFVQGPGRDPSDGGAGLGLAIARAIAESSGGHLTYQVGNERGTCLSLTLPAA